MKLLITFTISILLFSCSHNRTKILLTAQEVDGLDSEDQIYLNGFQIGDVTKMTVNPNGEINIECEVTNDIKIPTDSKFILSDDGLLGSKKIDVKLGSSDQIIKNEAKYNLTINDNSTFSDSLSGRVINVLENLTGTIQRDSILIELRRLNANLEKSNKLE